MLKKAVLLFVLLLSPIVSFAYGQSPSFVGPMSPGTVVTERQDPYFVGPQNAMDFKGFVDYIISTIITPAIVIIFASAVVFFLWNMLRIIQKSGDAEERAKMKEQAIWGIVGIAVMASMWGLVSFVTGTFGGAGGATVQIPGSKPACAGVTCSSIPDCARLGTCSAIPNR
ncbi:MAG: pilin [bacterium]|nr:pilin [bacterium]